MDETTFESILRETEPQVRSYLAGVGVPLHAIDDVAQDVYLALYRGTDRMPQNIEPIRWLKGIARNLAKSYFRRSRTRETRHLQAVSEILSKQDIGEESLHSYWSATDVLRECVTKLSEKNRQMLTMRYVECTTSDTIAEALKTSASAIRIALLRIRETLRRCVVQAFESEVQT
jgi:RNA polymerase sigma-70 factor (ECF subfamily)